MAVTSVTLTITAASGGVWTSPSNAIGANGVYASYSVPSAYSAASFYFNHNAPSVKPANKVLVGCVLNVKGYVNTIVGGGVNGLTGLDFPFTAFTSTSNTVYTFGSTTNPLSFNDALTQFGLRFSAGSTPNTFYIDDVNVTLYYDDAYKPTNGLFFGTNC